MSNRCRHRRQMIGSPASLATSLPLPIATPMSAIRSAGASLTPSPVIATTAPPACSAPTMRILCAGLVRANTPTPRTASRSAVPPSASSAAPVRQRFAPRRPRSRAIARAVKARQGELSRRQGQGRLVCARGESVGRLRRRREAAASGRGGQDVGSDEAARRAPNLDKSIRRSPKFRTTLRVATASSFGRANASFTPWIHLSTVQGEPTVICYTNPETFPSEIFLLHVQFPSPYGRTQNVLTDFLDKSAG